MKKIMTMLLAALMLICCAACTMPELDGNYVEPVPQVSQNDIDIPQDEDDTQLDFLPLSFYFYSGAGGWGTELHMAPDGSFTGYYHDSELGITGEGYPDGTLYLCHFEGRFENIMKVDEHTYSMTLGEVELRDEDGREWIENDVRYIATTPYGLDGGSEFLLYLPQTPTDGLPEDFMIWWPHRFDEQCPDTLSYYAIRNMGTDDGFFAIA